MFINNEELDKYPEYAGYRKMVLFVEAGVGTKDARAYLISNDVDQKHLDDYAWHSALEHASSYGTYPMSERPDDCDEDEEDSYSDDIEGWWEEYTPEHDGQLIFGANSSFQWCEL